jgi:hypothetical protein
MINKDEGSLQTRASSALFDLANAVQAAPDAVQIRLTRSFSSLEFLDPKVERADLIARLGKKCIAIYLIKLGPSADWIAVRDALNSQKTGKLDGRAYPQINKTSASEYMYVGSSRDCVKRLIEHLGLGGKRTYSLQMSSWATSLVGDFEIEILKYTDIDQIVLCAIEDQLSKELKPLFGRRGSR